MCYGTQFIYSALQQLLLYNRFSPAEIRLEVPTHQTVLLKIGEA